MPENVLAIDTSTDIRVGVAINGVVMARGALANTRQHVEQLTPLIAESLSSAGLRPGDLELICVGLGPGPFTGLRVGIAAAQVLAEVNGIPLHGVCGLDVLAAQAVRDGAIPAGAGFLAVCDARRKEVYWAEYAADGCRISGPDVGPPESLRTPGRDAMALIGPGADLVDERRATADVHHVDAGLMALLGRSIESAGTEPLYLRRPDAKVSTKRKSALPTNRPRLRRR